MVTAPGAEFALGARARARTTSLWRHLRLFGYGSAWVLCACGVLGEGAANSPASPEPLQDPPVLVRRGRGALLAGDSVRAEQYLVLAMHRGGDRDRIMPLLIRACLEGGRMRAALGYAEIHLTEYPEETQLRFLVATIHAALGEDGAAIVELQRILDRHPVHAESHYLLGTLLEAGDPGGARDHFRQYLEREPHGEHASAALGWLIMTKDADMAGNPSAKGRSDDDSGQVGSAKLADQSSGAPTSEAPLQEKGRQP